MEWLSPEGIWLVLGMVLILSEFVIPGLIVVFFGIGAFAVGLLMWGGVIPRTGALPFLLFSIVSVGTLLLLRRRFETWFSGRSIDAEITGIDDDFVGHYAEVVSGFDAGSPDHGRVMYRGAAWDASHRAGKPLRAGDRVRIEGRQGSVLVVDKE